MADSPTTVPSAQAPAAAPAVTTPATAEVTKDSAAATAPATAAVETKPTEAKPDTAKSGEAKAQETAPADIEVKLPDGVEADTKLLDGLKAIAKEHGLKSEAAQKLVDLYVAGQKESDAKLEQFKTQVNEKWVSEIKADKEFGGQKYEQTVNDARRALEWAGGQQLRDTLGELGVGNHPGLVRAFAKFGRALAEDTVSGDVRSPAPKGNGLAARYPNSPELFQQKQ